MKQWLRSMVLLSIPVIALGCKSDPTASNSAGVAAKLIATPKTLFITQGTSEAVSVVLADSNNNPVPGSFTFTQPIDAAFTVTLDTTPRLIYNSDGVLVQNSTATSARFVVEATGLATSSFQVTSGGVSTTVAVTSVPTNLAGTFSTVTPTAGQVVTLTAPAGLTFSPNARITSGATGSAADTVQVGFVRTVSGASLTFVPVAGLDKTVTVRGVIPAYAPTLSLNLPSTTKITVGNGLTTVKLAGTDAIATAPSIKTLAKGESYLLYDKPPFGFSGGCLTTQGDKCNLYKVTTTVAGQAVHVLLTYDNTSDLGVFVLNSAGTGLAPGAGSADNLGTGTSTEAGDLTFATPGTYYIAVLRFTYAGSTADPGFYSLMLTGL